jgi:hypothetical protein
MTTPVLCVLGYSDFHNLMRFTSKKMPNNILKMFVNKVFQLFKPFLANLHFTSSNIYSDMYSMTPKIFCSFLAYEYSKFPEYYADFKSVKIIEKNPHRKSYLPNTFAS